MKYEQLWKDIETLCALRGPSGREAAVREYLIEQIKGHAEYEVDPLGNLLVRKKGKKPAKKVLQLSAGGRHTAGGDRRPHGAGG